jgi:hypothetical protein
MNDGQAMSKQTVQQEYEKYMKQNYGIAPNYFRVQDQMDLQ